MTFHSRTILHWKYLQKTLGNGKPTDQSRLTTEPQLQSCGLHLAVLYGSNLRGIFYWQSKGKVLLLEPRGLCGSRNAAVNILDLRTRVVTTSKTYLSSYFMTNVSFPLFSKSYHFFFQIHTYIHTLHLDIIKVLFTFIYQLMHNWIILKAI